MARGQGMSADDIQKALKNAGISQAGIARDLKVSNALVSRVISGKDVSDRVMKHIAKCINQPVAEIWPAKATPTKKGRPMSSGLYDSETAA